MAFLCSDMFKASKFSTYNVEMCGSGLLTSSDFGLMEAIKAAMMTRAMVRSPHHTWSSRYFWDDRHWPSILSNTHTHLHQMETVITELVLEWGFFFLTFFQLWWFSAQSFHLWTQISIILWAVMRGRSTVWTDAPFLTVSEETSSTNLEQGAKFVLCFNDCIKPPTQTCFSFFTFSRHRIYSFRFYSSSSVVALIQGQNSPLGDMNAEVLLSIEPLQFVMGTKL